MARFYVKKNDKWNIFSSIADGFLYSDFMPFEELQAVVIEETVVDKMKDLGTLLTSSPRLNTMSYEEAEEHIRARRLADVYEEGDGEMTTPQRSNERSKNGQNSIEYR